MKRDTPPFKNKSQKFQESFLFTSYWSEHNHVTTSSCWEIM